MRSWAENRGSRARPLYRLFRLSFDGSSAAKIRDRLPMTANPFVRIDRVQIPFSAIRKDHHTG